VANLYDSPGNDTFIASPDSAKLSGNGFSNQVRFFDRVFAFAIAGGFDTASLYGSAGDDVFTGTPTFSRIVGNGYRVRADFFEAVYGYGGGGNDRGFLYDSAGHERLEAAANWARMSYAAAAIQAMDFCYVRAISAAGGSDTQHVDPVRFRLETRGPWIGV